MDSVMVCRICEEEVRVVCIQEHSRVCAIANKCDCTSMPVDSRLRRLAAGLERLIGELGARLGLDPMLAASSDGNPTPPTGTPGATELEAGFGRLAGQGGMASGAHSSGLGRGEEEERRGGGRPGGSGLHAKEDLLSRMDSVNKLRYGEGIRSLSHQGSENRIESDDEESVRFGQRSMSLDTSGVQSSGGSNGAAAAAVKGTVGTSKWSPIGRIVIPSSHDCVSSSSSTPRSGQASADRNGSTGASNSGSNPAANATSGSGGGGGSGGNLRMLEAHLRQRLGRLAVGRQSMDDFSSQDSGGLGFGSFSRMGSVGALSGLSTRTPTTPFMGSPSHFSSLSPGLLSSANMPLSPASPEGFGFGRQSSFGRELGREATESEATESLDFGGAVDGRVRMAGHEEVTMMNELADIAEDIADVNLEQETAAEDLRMDLADIDDLLSRNGFRFTSVDTFGRRVRRLILSKLSELPGEDGCVDGESSEGGDEENPSSFRFDTAAEAALLPNRESMSIGSGEEVEAGGGSGQEQREESGRGDKSSNGRMKAGGREKAGKPRPEQLQKLGPSRTSISDFEILKPISKGAYGRVFLARKKATGDLFAIKVLRKVDMVRKNAVASVLAERDILTAVRSPFVVRCFYTFTSKDSLFLVMEYLNGGDLFSLLRQLGCLDEAMAKTYIAELVLALEYLHNLGVVHRDIKPDNLLIAHDGHIKLTDFGLSVAGIIDSQGDFSTNQTTALDANPSTMMSADSHSSLVNLACSSGVDGFPLSNRNPLLDSADVSDQLYGSSLLSPASASFSNSSQPSPAYGNFSDPLRPDSFFPGSPRWIQQNDSKWLENGAASAASHAADVGNVQFGLKSVSLDSPSYESAHEARPKTAGPSGRGSRLADGMKYGSMRLDRDEKLNGAGVGGGVKAQAVGTPDYLAPEMLLGTGHGPAADWWSVGVVLFELLTGVPPFNAASTEEIFDNILMRDIPWPQIPDEMSYEAYDLINRLLTSDPELRLGARGAEEIKNHHFFADVRWETLDEETAAFVPQPNDPHDTSYFSTRQPLDPFADADVASSGYETSDSSQSDCSNGSQGEEGQDDSQNEDREGASIASQAFTNFSFKNLSQLALINYDLLESNLKATSSPRSKHVQNF